MTLLILVWFLHHRLCIDISYCLNEDGDEMITIHIMQQRTRFDDNQHFIDVIITWKAKDNQQIMVSSIVSCLRYIFKASNGKYIRQDINQKE